MAYENAVFIEDAPELIEETYRLINAKQSNRHGQSFRNIFKPGSRKVTGDGVTVRAKIGRGDRARATNNPLAAFPGGNKLTADEFKIRWNEKVPAANDFTLIQATVPATVFSEANKESVTLPIVEEMVSDANDQMELSLNRLRNMNRAAKLANVNGTAVENDSYRYDQATTTADNTDGARFKIDEGSISFFEENQVIDIFDAANGVYTARNVVVRGINYDDGSIGVNFNTDASAGPLSTGDLSNVADNDELYLSGEKDQGMYSLGAYMENPVAGESFIGGIDRTAQDRYYMRPQNIRQDSTSRALQRNDIDNAMRKLRQHRDEDRTMALHLSLEMAQHIRNNIYEDKMFVSLDAKSSPMGKRYVNEGTIDGVIQHPSGMIKTYPDPFCARDRIELLELESWFTYTHPGPGGAGLFIMPGTYKGKWSRLNDASGQPGKELVMQMFEGRVDFCEDMQSQVRILNVTPGNIN